MALQNALFIFHVTLKEFYRHFPFSKELLSPFAHYIFPLNSIKGIYGNVQVFCLQRGKELPVYVITKNFAIEHLRCGKKCEKFLKNNLANAGATNELCSLYSMYQSQLNVYFNKCVWAYGVFCYFLQDVLQQSSILLQYRDFLFKRR